MASGKGIEHPQMDAVQALFTGTPAGFVAAMVKDVPMNDRCSWLTVDGDGTILDADNNLGSLKVPAGEPVVIGGGAMPPPVDDLQKLAAEVRGLQLPRKQSALKEQAAEAIEQGRIADALALLAQFGIGDNQPQAATWKAVIADLRGLQKPVLIPKDAEPG